MEQNDTHLKDSKVYLGVKLLYAKEATYRDFCVAEGIVPLDGEGNREGYIVEVDGYIAETYNPIKHMWIPKDTFESMAFAIEQPYKISKTDVDRWEKNTSFNIDTHNGFNRTKTTLVMAEHPTGYVNIETSSCVYVPNYDENYGFNICKHKMLADVWSHLGFILQWARNGLRWKQVDGR